MQIKYKVIPLKFSYFLSKNLLGRYSQRLYVILSIPFKALIWYMSLYFSDQGIRYFVIRSFVISHIYSLCWSIGIKIQMRKFRFYYFNTTSIKGKQKYTLNNNSYSIPANSLIVFILYLKV